VAVSAAAWAVESCSTFVRLSAPTWLWVSWPILIVESCWKMETSSAEIWAAER